jgi:glycosyltransferase involved in cell wall biosynthesis
MTDVSSDVSGGTTFTVEPSRGSVALNPGSRTFGSSPLSLLAKARLTELRNGRLGHLEPDPARPLRVPARYHRTSYPTRVASMSIVTPSFNHAAYLPHTIESVLNQRHPNLEYFVQDGGSFDGTRELLEHYDDRLTGWDSQDDRGQAHAINRAFAKTSGEIMAYLNSDDMLLPGALAYVSRYFHDHPEVDVVYGHRVLIDPDGMEVGRQVLPHHVTDVLRWADYVPQETLFWRRSIWDRAGGSIDESFQFAMDWDLLLRFVDADARIVRLPRFLGAFRVHPSQKTQACWTVGEKEMFRLRRRVLGRDVEYPEIHANLQDYLRQHRRYQRLYRLGLYRG